MAKQKKKPAESGVKSPAELREMIEALEVKLADKGLSPIANCEVHIEYWRLREALASQGTRRIEDPDNPGEYRAPNFDELKFSYLVLRQSTEQCAVWEQRRTAALKLEEIETMRRCEEKIDRKHKATDDLSTIAT